MSRSTTSALIVLLVSTCFASLYGQTVNKTYAYDDEGSLTRAEGQLRLTGVAGYELQPQRVAPGDSLLIYGRGFPFDNPNSINVAIGGVVAAVESVGTNVIRVTVPPTATGGVVQVLVTGGSVFTVGTATLEAVVIAPTRANLDYGQTQQFNATLIGLAAGTIEWSVNGILGGDSTVGTIDATGFYTAPSAAQGADFPFTISGFSPDLGITGYAAVQSACAGDFPIADEVLVPGTLPGNFGRVCYRFTASAGEYIYAAYFGTATARSFSIRDAEDRSLLRVTNGSTLQLPSFTIPADGNYTLQVESSTGAGGTFEVWLNREAVAPPAGTWLSPYGGDWHVPGNWARGQLPRASDPVAISNLVGGGDITLRSGSQAAASIDCDLPLQATGGSLFCPGSMRVEAEIYLNGTAITGASILPATGGELLRVGTSGNSRLIGCDVQRNITQPSSSRLRIGEGTRLRSTLQFTGSSASLSFEGDHTLEGSIETAGSNSPNYIEMQAAGTLTIASSGSIRGGRLNIGGRFWFGQEMVLVNEGTIEAMVLNRTMDIEAESFEQRSGSFLITNGGRIVVHNAYALRSLVSLDTGARLSLLGTGTIEPGTLILNGGALEFSSSTGALASVQYASGTVNLVGAVDNRDRVLEVDGAVTWNLVGCVLSGGTIKGLRGGALRPSASGTSRLLGVDVQAELIFPNSGRLRVDSSTRLKTDVTFAGSSGSLAFEGDFRFEGTVNSTASNSPNYLEMQTAGTLIIDAGARIVGGRLSIGGTFWFGRSMTLINEGDIESVIANRAVDIDADIFVHRSGTLRIASGAQLNIRNAYQILSPVSVETGARLSLLGTGTIAPGALSLRGGQLDISNSTAPLAQVDFRSGSVVLTGTLDNTGTTLVVDGNVTWTLGGCAMTGGTLASINGGALTVTTSGSNRLVDVDVQCALMLPNSARLRVGGSTRLNTQITFTGSSASLAFEGSHLFEGDLDSTASTSPNYVEMQADGTLTVAAGASMRGGALTIGGVFWYGRAMNLVNEGTIESAISGRLVTIAASTFEHRSGSLLIGGGARMVLDDAYVISSPVSIDAMARLSLLGPGTIAPGAVTLNGGELTISNSTSPLSSLNYLAGEVVLTGNMDNSGTSLDLPGAVEWRFSGCAMTGGTITSAGAGVLKPTTSGNNRIVGVDVQCDIEMAQATRLRIGPMTRLTGQIDFVANAASLAFEGDHTFEGIVVSTSSTSPNHIEMHTAGTFTIAPGAALYGGALTIGGTYWYGRDMTLINEGTIDSSVASRLVDIAAMSFEHRSGAMTVASGARIAIRGSYQINSAVSVGTGARLSLLGTGTVTPGVLSLNGGTLDIEGSTAPLAAINLTSGSVVLSGTLDNTGNTLVIDGAVSWSFSACVLTGGSVVAINSGTLVPSTSGANRLVDVDLQCDLAMGSSSRLRVGGTSRLRGLIAFTGSSGSLAFEGDHVFEGAVDATATAGVNYVEMQAAGMLTIAAGAALRGGNLRIGGSFWYGRDMTLVNEGTIESAVASRSLEIQAVSFEQRSGSFLIGANARAYVRDSFQILSPIVVDPSARLSLLGTGTAGAGNLTLNGGTLDVSGASAVINAANLVSGLVILTGTVDNSGTTLDLDSAVAWRFEACFMTGGTLLSTTGGSLDVSTSGTNRILDVDVQCGVTMGSSARLRVAGTSRLGGLIQFVGANASLGFEGDHTFEGVADSTGTPSRNHLEMQTAGTLTVASGATIRGGSLTVGGVFWHGRDMTLINEGLIESTVASRILQIEADSVSNTTGILRASSGGSLRVDALLQQSGDVQCDSSSTLDLRGGVQQSGGVFTLDGQVTGSGNYDLQSGVLTGSGSLSGNLTNAGTVRPGGAGSTGSLNVAGTYDQAASGRLEIDLGGLVPGTDFDRVVVGSASTIDGALAINVIGGFMPSLGHTFTIIPSAGASGTFSSISGAALPGGLTAAVSVGASGVTLTAQ